MAIDGGLPLNMIGLLAEVTVVAQVTKLVDLPVA